MKFHDVVSISSEDVSLLSIADSCYALPKAEMSVIKQLTETITKLQTDNKGKVLTFIASMAFVSLSILFSGLLKENPVNTKKFFESFTEEDLNSAAGRIVAEKMRLYYTLKLISSTFDDKNLLNLKKALNTDE